MFHFTWRRIETRVCICFVDLKVYKKLEGILKNADIKLSMDKILAIAKTITTIQINRPLNKTVVPKTLIMRRPKIIAQLFDDDFWSMQ